MKNKIIKLILGLLFSIGVFTYIILANGLDKIMKQLLMLDPYWIILAIFAMVIYWILEAKVLHMIASSLKAKIRFRDSFKVTMTGQFFNSITPFATGGQPAQAYELSKNGINLGVGSSILTGKFIVYQSVLTLYSFIILVFKLGFFKARLSNFTHLATIGFIVNTAVIVFLILLSSYMNFAHFIVVFLCKFLEKIRIIKDADKLVEKIQAQLKLFRDSFVNIRSNPLLILKTSLLTMLQLLSFFIIPYFIYRAFGLNGKFIGNMIAAEAFVVMITSFIPIPGASGGAEGSFYMFFSLFFGKSIIGIAVLIWRIITFYFNILFGGLFTLLSRREASNQKI
ncbi:lysylphosphatidylglycerol synthase transmembrane domain-containing protein [Proteiniborus sp.]|uniref:lysylphosphatidylglycerol synthase transmembrane domain-containing protein n=1 Tax=Proteiniborus sp. TaxID=2079015 RepID=UPI00331A9025